MNWFKIPRARLNKTDDQFDNEISSSNETISTIRSSERRLDFDEFEQRKYENDKIIITTEINEEINFTTKNNRQTQTSPNDFFQGPKNLYSRFPILGRQRFIVNLIKFPSLISVICGCLLIFGNIYDFTNLLRSLSIVSVVSGCYSFLLTWLICGQLNYQHTPGDTVILMNVKIVQLFGSLLFFTTQTVLAILSVVETKQNHNNYFTDDLGPEIIGRRTTTTTTTTEKVYSSKSTVLTLIGILMTVAIISVCLTITATIFAVKAKGILMKELEKIERNNLARANAINFSFARRLRVTGINPT